MLVLTLDALVGFLCFLSLRRLKERPWIILTLDAIRGGALRSCGGPSVCVRSKTMSRLAELECGSVPGATSMSTRSALDPHRSAQHSAQQERSTASERAAIANVTCHGTQKLKVCVCLFWFVYVGLCRIVHVGLTL